SCCAVWPKTTFRLWVRISATRFGGNFPAVAFCAKSKNAKSKKWSDQFPGGGYSLLQSSAASLVLCWLRQKQHRAPCPSPRKINREPQALLKQNLRKLLLARRRQALQLLTQLKRQLPRRSPRPAPNVARPAPVSPGPSRREC